MKSIIKLAAAIVFLSVLSACSTLNKMGLGLTELEAITGLKDALSQGMFRSFEAFANPNDESNSLVRFAFPGQAANIQKTLNDLGLGSVLDNATKKFTKAMGDAVQASKPIFVNSIKKMTIKDAMNILVTDNPNAATDYFKFSLG